MNWTVTAIWIALGLAASALAAPPAAAADIAAPDEAVATGSGEAPAAEPSDGPETVDPLTAFQRLDARPDAAAADADPGRCTPPEDRKPHGEVWGAVGSHDYRAGGASVEMPIGDCVRLGLSFGMSKGGYATPYDYGYGPGYGHGPGAYPLSDDITTPDLRRPLRQD